MALNGAHFTPVWPAIEVNTKNCINTAGGSRGEQCFCTSSSKTSIVQIKSGRGPFVPFRIFEEGGGGTPRARGGPYSFGWEPEQEGIPLAVTEVDEKENRQGGIPPKYDFVSAAAPARLVTVPG